MSIDVSSTASTVAAAPVSNNISSPGSGIADRSSSETSFKDEMTKVSEKNETKTETVKDQKVDSKKTSQKSDAKADKKQSDVEANENNTYKVSDDDNAGVLSANITFNNPQDAFSSANSMLRNDIAAMIENTSSLNTFSKNGILSFSIENGSTGSLKVSQGDAEFFLNLTQSNDLSSRNMIAQAQTMLNSGVSAKEVASNFKVSQALLNALSESRQNNQPLRIDFDQNISVILQVNKNGELAARFIPGDKAVEQYLKSNIESLKVSFEEQDLPYSELSYSNSSKEQNKRKKEQKQGE